MLATTVNLLARRAPSPQIRARDTSLDGAANGSAGVNSTPNVDAGINGATHLGGQRCGDHRTTATTAPMIESLPSIRRLLAHYPFNSFHDWHFEILFIVAIICQLIHILLEAL